MKRIAVDPKKQYWCSICGKKNTVERARRKRPCERCARENLKESWRAMHEKSGPMYDKWLRRWRAATGLQIGGKDARPKTSID